MNGILTKEQADLLRSKGKFPDDFYYLGTEDGTVKFKNKSEGFIIGIKQNQKENVT